MPTIRSRILKPKQACRRSASRTGLNANDPFEDTETPVPGPSQHVRPFSLNANDPFEDTETDTPAQADTSRTISLNANDPFEDTETTGRTPFLVQTHRVSMPTIRSRILKPARSSAARPPTATVSMPTIRSRILKPERCQPQRTQLAEVSMPTIRSRILKPWRRR